MKSRFHRRAYALCMSIFAVALTLVSFGAGCATPAADYVAADKSNYADVGADYRLYVEKDGALTPEERQAKLDSLEIWRQRVDAPEPAADAVKPVPEIDVSNTPAESGAPPP